MSDWREDRVGSALRGENPMVMARMRSGFAVIGDTQFLPGYCVLLAGDPGVSHLTDLDRSARGEFLFDMALLGEAIENVRRGERLRRMNYSVYGNELPALHAHVMPRYEWEPAEFIQGPWFAYPDAIRLATEHLYDDVRHGSLRAAIASELQRLMESAY